jgi:uncharacterized membrane protein
MFSEPKGNKRNRRKKIIMKTLASIFLFSGIVFLLISVVPFFIFIVEALQAEKENLPPGSEPVLDLTTLIGALLISISLFAIGGMLKIKSEGKKRIR